MRSVIKPGTSSSANCLCKTNPEECTWEVDCNLNLCVKNCVYDTNDEGEPYRAQVNDFCPGVVGSEGETLPNQNVTWDTEKQEWYDTNTKQTYPYYKKDKDGNFLRDKNDNKIATFVKDLRAPTLKPPFGGGTCHDKPNTRDLKVDCPTENVEKPIDGKYGEWRESETFGKDTTVQQISEKYSNWSDTEFILHPYNNSTAGSEVVGSGTLEWPEDNDLQKVIEQIRDPRILGHALNKTVHIINKSNGKVKLYMRGSINNISGESWEFIEGEQLNPNYDARGRPCINNTNLGLTGVALPGKKFVRTYVAPRYGGKDIDDIEVKIEPFLKKITLKKIENGTRIGKQITIGSGKFNWPDGEDLQKVIDVFREIRYKIDVPVSLIDKDKDGEAEVWHLIKYIEKVKIIK